MDLDITSESITIDLDWTLEVGVADLDLEGIADTNDAESAGNYDAARALTPEQLEAAFREAWPRIRDQMTVSVDGTPVPLELGAFDIPEVGNVEDARISTVTLTGALPDGASPIVVGWQAALGPLVVRQPGIEGGYSAFLTGGQLSDPNAR